MANRREFISKTRKPQECITFFVEHDMPADPFASIETSFGSETKFLS